MVGELLRTSGPDMGRLNVSALTKEGLLSRQRQVVVFCFCNQEGELLLEKRQFEEGELFCGCRFNKRECWALPGGKIEPGESGDEALRREFEEELGVRPCGVELAGIYGSEKFQLALLEDFITIHLYRIGGWTGEVDQGELLKRGFCLVPIAEALDFYSEYKIGVNSGNLMIVYALGVERIDSFALK